MAPPEPLDVSANELPLTLEKILRAYLKHRQGKETFQQFTTRHEVGKLQEMGYKNAQLYGADSGGPLGGLNAFFLLLDKPSTYNLPEKPLLPQRNVFADSLQGRNASDVENDPIALAASTSLAPRSGTVERGDERFAEAAVPVRSDGSMSGVNCTRRKSTPSARAKALASSVLATPGTPSSST